MNLIRSIWATAVFEVNRSLTTQRIIVASILAAFPPAMVFIIGISGGRIPLTDSLVVTLVAIVGLLAQLLWATSNVYTELEGKSWIFLASRPNGRICLFLGKYISAVAFSFAVCVVAISICLAIRTYLLGTQTNPVFAWLGMCSSALISCLTYSAIFSVIGTIFHKRSMVFGAGYVILSEIILANVPAIISRFTARFHLQNIAANWIGWFLPMPREDYILIYGESSLWFHLTCILIAIPILLTIGCVIITTRQYITAEEV